MVAVKIGKIMIAKLVGTGVAAFVFFVLPASTAAQVTKAQGSYIKPCASGDYSDFDCRPSNDETQAKTEKRLVAYQPDPVKYPVPRTKWDGKPDFAGVYWPEVTMVKPPVSLESLYRPETKAARAKLVSDENARLNCWPMSPTGAGVTGPLNIQITQGPGVVVVMDEHMGYYRIITTDGSPHDPQAIRSFLGDSRGHWEGDTLVVDVTGFNGRVRLGGGYGKLSPQLSSDELHIVERWTRPDARTLEYEEVTVEDPKMLTAPWKGPTLRRALIPEDRIFESICIEDNADLQRERAFFDKHPNAEMGPGGGLLKGTDK
jgi:hypothetical protein